MKEKYIEDLQEIKAIMNRSSRFLTLSGLSGITVGILALVGAYLSYRWVFEGKKVWGFDAVELSSTDKTNLLLISISTLLLSIVSVLILTTRAANKQGQKIWNPTAKHIVISLSIPLLAGGIVCLVFLSHGFVGLLPPLSLVFYGLALINTSKFTLDEIRNLGSLELLLGLLSFVWTDYALIFWSLGFGLLHIIYGVIVTKKTQS